MRKGVFSERVYEIVKTIPKGKVATYGQVARLAGRPGAGRAVGTVMSKNTDTKQIPCHRVVGAGGTLNGYAFGTGTDTKRSILESEGVIFKNGKIDLADSAWSK